MKEVQPNRQNIMISYLTIFYKSEKKVLYNKKRRPTEIIFLIDRTRN